MIAFYNQIMNDLPIMGDAVAWDPGLCGSDIERMTVEETNCQVLRVCDAGGLEDQFLESIPLRQQAELQESVMHDYSMPCHRLPGRHLPM